MMMENEEKLHNCIPIWLFDVLPLLPFFSFFVSGVSPDTRSSSCKILHSWTCFASMQSSSVKERMKGNLFSVLLKTKTFVSWYTFSFCCMIFFSSSPRSSSFLPYLILLIVHHPYSSTSIIMQNFLDMLSCVVSFFFFFFLCNILFVAGFYSFFRSFPVLYRICCWIWGFLAASIVSFMLFLLCSIRCSLVLLLLLQQLPSPLITSISLSVSTPLSLSRVRRREKKNSSSLGWKRDAARIREKSCQRPTQVLVV